MLSFTNVTGRHVADIKMYTLSTCGWCKKTKTFLNDAHIAYSYLDIDLLSPGDSQIATKEQLEYNPEGSFPTIVINNGEKVIVGYDLAALKKLAGE
ncbi:MAG: glutaredoxin family protein [Christensenella sp.]|nr:glutaredoxin family protein [Christensenella sp.]